MARVWSDRLIYFFLEFFRKVRGHVRLNRPGEATAVDPNCSPPVQYVFRH